MDAVNPRYWDLVLAPFLCGARPEELLALRESDIDTDKELILVHQRATPGGGRPDKPGVLKVGLKERRRLVREEPDVRGRWTLFPKVLHPGKTGAANLPASSVRPAGCAPTASASGSVTAASVHRPCMNGRGIPAAFAASGSMCMWWRSPSRR